MLFFLSWEWWRWAWRDRSPAKSEVIRGREKHMELTLSLKRAVAQTTAHARPRRCCPPQARPSLRSHDGQRTSETIQSPRRSFSSSSPLRQRIESQTGPKGDRKAPLHRRYHLRVVSEIHGLFSIRTIGQRVEGFCVFRLCPCQMVPHPRRPRRACVGFLQVQEAYGL